MNALERRRHDMNGTRQRVFEETGLNVSEELTPADVEAFNSLLASVWAYREQLDHIREVAERGHCRHEDERW